MGEWLQPGQHLDLIGAYRPDMREVDDEALTRARIFVDARATTIHHIGELKDPIARGVITEGDVVADFYDIAKGSFDRRDPSEITIAKNGGGAHLDLMTAAYIAGRLGKIAGNLGDNWSEREDSNLRPPAPEAGALPGCATLRPWAAG